MQYTPDLSKNQMQAGPPALGYLTKLSAEIQQPKPVKEGGEVKIFDNKLFFQRFKGSKGKRDQWKVRLKNLQGVIAKAIQIKVWRYDLDRMEMLNYGVLLKIEAGEWLTVDCPCYITSETHQIWLFSLLTGVNKVLGTKGSSRMYGWSHKSRVALIRKLMEVTASSFEMPMFISLTYHENFPDAQGAKKHLRNFFKRLHRIDNPKGTKKEDEIQSGNVWKLEFQERGAPHFHIIFFPAKCSKLQGKMGESLIKSTWHDVAKDGKGKDHHHAKYGTDVERVETLSSFKKMFRYTAKYASKQVDASGKNGRYWGTSNNVIDHEKTVVFDVSKSAEVQIRRIAKRLLRGVKAHHGNRQIYQKFSSTDQTRKDEKQGSQRIGGQYFEIPKQAGYLKSENYVIHSKAGPVKAIRRKYVDLTRYSRSITKDFLGWNVHLGMGRENAERLMQWCIDGNKEW